MRYSILFPLVLLLFCQSVFGQGFTPPWADKSLPLEVRGRQLSVQNALFSLYVAADTQLEQLKVELHSDRRKELKSILTTRAKVHAANLNDLKTLSNLGTTTQEDIAAAALRRYQESEWVAEEKLATSIEEELDPIERDRLLRAVGRRSSFFGHPLAIHRLKLSESQATNLRSMALLKAATVLEAVSKNDLLNPNKKAKADLGVGHAMQIAKIFAQLTDQQLKDYLDFMGGFENGATSRDFFLSMDHGEAIVEHLKSRLDSVDRL